MIGQGTKGRIVDDETELALSSAATAGVNDLRDGSGHHGANWVAYLHRLRPHRRRPGARVRRASRRAADDAGITRLDWLDTVQSAAQATTWPLGRGMHPTPVRADPGDAPGRRGHRTEAVTG